MKHGYGEFHWQTGSIYKGHYHQDVKQGFGEMFWADGSIYKGFWENGVQSGLGLMIFQDGMKKAGFFKQNIYQTPLTTIKQFEDFEKIEMKKIPA